MPSAHLLTPVSVAVAVVAAAMSDHSSVVSAESVDVAALLSEASAVVDAVDLYLENTHIVDNRVSAVPADPLDSSDATVVFHDLSRSSAPVASGDADLPELSALVAVVLAPVAAVAADSS